MITFSILLNLIGGILFYHLSQQKEVRNFIPLFNYINQNKKISNVIGGLLLGTALFINIITFGFLSGILIWLFLISIILSLIVLLSPLQILNYKTLGLLILVCLIFETLIN